MQISYCEPMKEFELKVIRFIFWIRKKLTRLIKESTSNHFNQQIVFLVSMGFLYLKLRRIFCRPCQRWRHNQINVKKTCLEAPFFKNWRRNGWRSQHFKFKMPKPYNGLDKLLSLIKICIEKCISYSFCAHFCLMIDSCELKMYFQYT